jgi:hypothetical protein
MMLIGLRFEPWGIAAKIKFKKANRGKNMMRSFVVSNHDSAVLPRELLLFDDAKPSLQASLLAVAISGPAG